MGASVRTDTMDWPQVIAQIRGEGVMLKAIARRVGVAPTTLGNLYQGLTKEPCWSVGDRLLKLRERVAR